MLLLLWNHSISKSVVCKGRQCREPARTAASGACCQPFENGTLTSRPICGRESQGTVPHESQAARSIPRAHGRLL